MRDWREYFEHYVARLSTDWAEDAWHSLVEAGPAGMPHVVEAFHATADPSVQAALVRVVREYRSEGALPYFVEAISSEHSIVWKETLDGLVALSQEAAFDALATARSVASGEKRDWIEEAIEQAIRG